MTHYELGGYIARPDGAPAVAAVLHLAECLVRAGRWGECARVDAAHLEAAHGRKDDNYR